MRMGVLFGGAAVRGPARVADAEDAIDRVQADGIFEIAQLARGAADRELIVVAIDGEAGRIVAAVFEALQAVQNDGDGLWRRYSRRFRT